MASKIDQGNPQQILKEAFQKGLQQAFGDVVGKVLGHVILYHPRTKLETARLKKIVETDGGAILNAVVANQADGSTMQLIRSNTIGSAILADADGVVRWATEGKNRCTRMAGDWPATEAEWDWIVQNANQYIRLVREVKYFLNQV